MAFLTLRLAATDGCVASLNYNDATLTATGVTVDNTGGAVPVTFYCTISGAKQSTTVQPGNSSQVVFPSARSVTINGIQLTVAGLTSFGIGTGAAIGT